MLILAILLAIVLAPALFVAGWIACDVTTGRQWRAINQRVGIAYAEEHHAAEQLRARTRAGWPG